MVNCFILALDDDVNKRFTVDIDFRMRISNINKLIFAAGKDFF